MFRSLHLTWAFARINFPSWAVRATYLFKFPKVDGRRIDPKAHAFSQLLNLVADDDQAYEVDVLRGQINGMLSRFAKAAPKSVQRRAHHLPGAEGLRPARIYHQPGQDPLADQPTLLFFHGGGYVVGSLDAYDELCAMICDRSGMRVVSFDYRLAPEHPFPAAPNDALACYRGLISGTDGLIASPGNLVVGGDSAGGNLTASLMHSLAEQGAPMPKAQLLIYPAVDMRLQSQSLEVLKDQPVLPLRMITWFMDQYAKQETDPRNPRLSPVFSDRLNCQPPALILAAGHDPLWDDAHAYAAALEKAGVPVTLDAYPGQVHGFVSLTKIIPQGMEAVEKISNWLKSSVK